jgi:hypothetical protein
VPAMTEALFVVSCVSSCQSTHSDQISLRRWVEVGNGEDLAIHLSVRVAVTWK